MNWNSTRINVHLLYEYCNLQPKKELGLRNLDVFWSHAFHNAFHKSLPFIVKVKYHITLYCMCNLIFHKQSNSSISWFVVLWQSCITQRMIIIYYSILRNSITARVYYCLGWTSGVMIYFRHANNSNIYNHLYQQ